MFVVRVVPITRGVFTDALSFFSKDAVEPGVIVHATVRGREIPALVLEATEVREEKALLKQSGFSLKKLSTKGARRVFSDSVIAAAREASMWYGTSVGAVLSHFSPTAVLESARTSEPAAVPKGTAAAEADLLVLQAEFAERVSAYRNLTREAFARGASIMIMAPTTPEAEALTSLLARGIEAQVVTLTSSLSKKSLLTLWNRAVSDQGPLLIISTQQFLTLPRAEVGIMVIERESARTYAAQPGREREAFDARIMAEHVARERGATLVFADFPMRVETKTRLAAHELTESSRFQMTSRGGARVSLIEMRKKKTDDEPKKKFSTLSDEATRLIESTIAHKGRVAIYAARRGFAPLTICHDCGTPVIDQATGAPMSLQKTTRGNVFISFRSGAILPSETTCRVCGGWNLVSLGIGVERVYEEVRSRFPHTPLSLLTAETAPTHAGAKKIHDHFFNSTGAIIVGTDRMIPYLNHVDLTVVASADGMLSVPAWRAEEYALHTIYTLRDHTAGTLIIQTRNPDSIVFKAAQSGNPAEYFEHELGERKKYGYPSFATFIGLTWMGTERAVQDLQVKLLKILTPWDVVGPLPPRAVAKGRYLARAVVRLPENSWPNEALSKVLATLPSEVAITIDPDDIV